MKMNLMVNYFICLTILWVGGALAHSHHKNSIRNQFTSRFYERCSKYPFVEKYLELLQNPPQKYLIFEYQKTGLKNGGFGDRMGGVITAFIHAIRFKRSIYMSASSNGMHNLFRPFHPKFIHNPAVALTAEDLVHAKKDIYFWNNWGNWSGFNEWKKNHSDYVENPKSYEYNLGDCVDITVGGFSAKKTKKCAMDSITTEKINNYPIIRMASNRAYLCHYENHTDLPSHSSVFDSLGIIPGQDDLFEVAGCIARLMLWPTDYLWDLIDRAYALHFRELLTESPDQLLQLIDRERHPEKFENNEDHATPRKKRKTKEEKKAFRKLVKKNKKALLQFVPVELLLNKTTTETTSTAIDSNDNIGSSEFISEDDVEEAVEIEWKEGDTILPVQTSSVAVEGYTKLPNPPFQIGLHMRCGDYWSYRNFLLHTDGYHRTGCIYDEEDADRDEMIPYTIDPTTAKRSYYLNGGNPKLMGECVQGLVQHRQSLLDQKNRKTDASRGRRRFQVDPNGFFTFVDHDDDIAQSTDLSSSSVYVSNHTLVYITADNLMAEYQMKQYANHYPSIISPQGCHIEFDPSPECYELTAVYWFMLSLSNLIVSQTFSRYNAPTSAFSRYAGIYGLFPDSPFRSGRYCGDTVHSTTILSRLEQGNWYCK